MSIEIFREDRKTLQGVIDLHVHASPDLVPRPFDEADFARQARDVGYRAVLFKCQVAMNADRVQIVRKLVPGIDIFGGIVLNEAVGGLNVSVVETAIGFGAKEIWMPTFTASNDIAHKKSRAYPTLTKWKGISPVTSDGELLPQVGEILEVIADADVILGTGHLSSAESRILVEAARKVGVKKILVTHPEFSSVLMSVDEQVKLAELGAYIEHDFQPCMPHGQRYDPRLMVESIRKIGAGRTVLATDFGQYHSPHPIEGMRQFIHVMKDFGISDEEISMMTRDNPAKLLGL